jgi:adenine-specific DNA-methyltransferase
MQDTELPEKIEPTSLNLQTELAAQLAELVPEAMSDGKLDVTKLRELVNGDAENSPEKFGLFWPGKRAAQALAQIPTTATLVPAPEESVDWDMTKNIFIEGDNLEVLKVLQNSYRRKVKMIYIDPPYNTGKEFIYPDKFSEGLQGYLEYTGQKNEAGENVESKKETGGRKHSNWLSMMYPRLQLAKSLLTNDGVIFISIDDNEQADLKKLCDEVFGEDNFIAQIIWKKKVFDNNEYLPALHDYQLVYARNKDVVQFNLLPRNEQQLAQYRLDDNDGNGVYKLEKLTAPTSGGRYSQATDFVITDPANGNEYRSNTGNWRFGKNTIDELISKNQINFDGGLPRYKLYLKNVKDGVSANTFWDDVDKNLNAAKQILDLFGAKVFETPKPVGLIERMLEIASDKSSIILDFFAGSSTTAHAVMRLNAKDGGSRTNIQVQLPELIDNKSDAGKAGFKTITDISKERIRRAGKKIREDYADKIAQRSTLLDTGFRVYKLAPSNFVQWDENKAKDDIQQSVLDFAANKKPDTAPESLLTEIMLQARMPLSANIEKRDLKNGGWVYVVDGGSLIAYVADEQITEAQANEIADLAPAKLIVLDSAFNGNNALKINVIDICKEKFIKEFKTI